MASTVQSKLVLNPYCVLALGCPGLQQGIAHSLSREDVGQAEQTGYEGQMRMCRGGVIKDQGLQGASWRGEFREGLLD